jgi:iron-sulfur cluster repair protein YtfE (RIC family)
MAKKSIRQTRTPTIPSAFEEARDELFQHIMRCGVVGADHDDQVAWFNETMPYFIERYHELGEDQIKQLRTLGERFSQPPKKKDDASAA